MLQAAPLGILAIAQTVLMLTGGIDLSMTMIATAYVAANQFPNGAAPAIMLGLLVGLIVGGVNGVNAERTEHSKKSAVSSVRSVSLWCISDYVYFGYHAKSHQNVYPPTPRSVATMPPPPPRT